MIYFFLAVLIFNLGLFLVRQVIISREYKALADKRNAEVLQLTDGILVEAGVIECPVSSLDELKNKYAKALARIGELEQENSRLWGSQAPKHHGGNREGIR